MYSRNINQAQKRENEVRIPKNYSGNAFSFDPPPISRADLTVEEKSAPEEQPEKAEKVENRPDDRLSALGLSFEDLLIIALILILSQSADSEDILILLVLVLAYKK